MIIFNDMLHVGSNYWNQDYEYKCDICWDKACTHIIDGLDVCEK